MNEESNEEEESSSLGNKTVSRKKAQDLEPLKLGGEKSRGYCCAHAPASQRAAATRHSRPTGVKHKGEDTAHQSRLHTSYPKLASKTQERSDFFPGHLLPSPLQRPGSGENSWGGRGEESGSFHLRGGGWGLKVNGQGPRMTARVDRGGKSGHLGSTDWSESGAQSVLSHRYLGGQEFLAAASPRRT